MTQLRDTMQGTISRLVLPALPLLGGGVTGGLTGSLGGVTGGLGTLGGAYGLLSSLLGSISSLVLSLLNIGRTFPLSSTVQLNSNINRSPRWCCWWCNRCRWWPSRWWQPCWRSPRRYPWPRSGRAPCCRCRWRPSRPLKSLMHKFTLAPIWARKYEAACKSR